MTRERANDALGIKSLDNDQAISMPIGVRRWHWIIILRTCDLSK